LGNIVSEYCIFKLLYFKYLVKSACNKGFEHQFYSKVS
jgi:hypothetical protein